MSRPLWLPDTVEVGGNFSEVLDRLYDIFTRDFKISKLTYNGIPVNWNHRKANQGFEEAFWHLITKIDNRTQYRLFDPKRAERLPWCAPVIQNASDHVVKSWRYREGTGKIRNYLWLNSFDYVVILEEKRTPNCFRYFLVTAFCVDRQAKKKDLESRYNKRL